MERPAVARRLICRIVDRRVPQESDGMLWSSVAPTGETILRMLVVRGVVRSWKGPFVMKTVDEARGASTTLLQEFDRDPAGSIERFPLGSGERQWREPFSGIVELKEGESQALASSGLTVQVELRKHRPFVDDGVGRQEVELNVDLQRKDEILHSVCLSGSRSEDLAVLESTSGSPRNPADGPSFMASALLVPGEGDAVRVRLVVRVRN
jgi:hypothetical protein